MGWNLEDQKISQCWLSRHCEASPGSMRPGLKQREQPGVADVQAYQKLGEPVCCTPASIFCSHSPDLPLRRRDRSLGHHRRVPSQPPAPTRWAVAFPEVFVLCQILLESACSCCQADSCCVLWSCPGEQMGWGGVMGRGCSGARGRPGIQA